ncbi:MAG TPA: SDR family NAD(P)-dependent oxidoreductase [Streptosporangiaceae bacterium]|nr:SDR family NAD(P)-dependent oxidoreductase [Streptosporangiaceae bacterium]
MARTLDRRQGRGPHRSAVIARDRDELAAGLRALGAGERHPAVVSGTDGQAGPGVAFVFSGYGSQWPGMGRALAAAEPAFADALAELEQPLREATGIGGLALTGAAADDALRQVEVAQPVLFGFQVALARLWEAHGVRPVAVIGHSMGEVAAAVVSGALSVADGARVIACRSRLLTRLAGAGAMAHVGLPADEVTGLAAGLPDVHLAVISSPVQCVVTGDAAQVGEVVARARARGAAARVLDAGGAGHSPQVDPLLAELTAQLADVAARPATTRFYSTAHDDPGALPWCDASYWAANLRRTVRLGPAVAAAAGDGLRTFVEVSPHPLLTRALDETVRHETSRPGVITGTLRRCADEVLAFHTQLATLAVGGYRLPRLRSGSIIDLPPAPWRHESYWADPPPRPDPAGHPLLGPHVELPAGGHAWQRRIDAETLGKLRAVREGVTLFPLSAAAEMIIAAACEAWSVPCTAVQASALRLVRLLPVGAGPALTTTLDGPAASGGGRRATVRIHAQDAVGTWKLVATGHVAEEDGTGDGMAEPAPRSEGPGVIPRVSTLLDRCLDMAGTDGEIPMAIGQLRVRGPAGSGGHCEVRNVRGGNGRMGSMGQRPPSMGVDGPSTPRADGSAMADLRLTAEAGGPPLLEALDVLLTRVPRAAIPVPYQDKLLELTWQPQDLPGAAAMDVPEGGPEQAHRYIHDAPPGRWIVLNAGSADGDLVDPGAAVLARELAACLRDAGHRADVVPALEPDGDAAPAGVVLMTPEVPNPAAAEHVVLEAVRAAASLAARPGRPPRLWIVTAGAMAARPGEAGDPGLGALRGLIRVLALERPGLRATLVDLDTVGGPRSAAATLAAELMADAPDDEVAWRDGRRLVARLARASAPRGRSGRTTRRPVVRPDGGYIVTGGCGGLGLVVARWLAERGASRIVLNSRSGAPPEARIALDQMRAAGARVRVVRGDVTQPGVAARLVAAARTGGTPLCGIVHAAGMFADALVDGITPADLSRVWAPKVEGAWRLHEAAEHADLDWFVLFSSAAALLGSPGQAAYASANAGLDALAAWRRARGLPATAINWGVWSGAGRAGDVAISGIDPISPEEGVEALEALLAEDRTAAGVIRIDPSAAAAAYPEIAAIPFFGSLLDADPGEGATAADWPGAAAIRAAGPERRRALIDQRARSAVTAVLGLPADQLPADLPLVDAGMDSLAAQRIGNVLEHDLGVAIDPALLLGGATLAQLQLSLAAELDGRSVSAQRRTPAKRYESSFHSASGAAPSRGVEPRDAAERQVARVAAEVLGAGPVGVTDDLRAAGLTPAARAEIAARLARETGHDLDPATLLAVPTVEAAAETVRQAEDGEAAGLIRPIRAGGPRLPVLLAHPAGGTTTVYKTLAGLLDGDRAVFGLERLDGGVGDRCERYAEAILERFPGGCVLGGWSFGGVLGYETARRLTAVSLVVLLDAALPLPVPAGDEEHVLARRFAAFGDYLTRTYGRAVRLPADELLGLSEGAQLDLVARRMAEAGLDGELSPAILRHQQTSYEDTRALERYVPGGYEGRVVLYRAERDTPWAVRDPRYEITSETRGWHRLCPRLEVVGIDAHHLNLLDPPAVTAVAAHLRELLSKIGGEP